MLRNKIKFDIDRNTLIVVVMLVAIMALAFFLRTYWAIGTSVDYGYSVSGGSDSYYHERILKHIIDSKHQLLWDPMLNYPIGHTNPRPPLFHWSIILMSFIFYPFMDPYTAAVFTLILFPAIWGTLTVIPVYLLGRESFNRKVGLVAAFLLAIMPAHMMRSVATQADWDAFNLFLIMFMFYFFLKALKEVKYKRWVKDWFKKEDVKSGLSEFFSENRRAVIYSALAGASLGSLALAWKGYTYALVILLVYLVVQIFINRFRNKSNLHIVVLTLIYTAVAFTMALPWYAGTNRLGNWYSVPLLLTLGVIVLALYFEATLKYPWPLVIGTGVMAVGITAIILNVFFPDFWESIVSGQGYFVKSKLYSTIAEAQPATLGIITMSFGIGTFFLSIFGVFYILYLVKKNRSEHYLFFVIYALVSVYMAISAARFMFNASPTIALLGAVALVWLIEKVRVRKSMEEFARYKGSVGKSLKRNVKISQIVTVTVVAILVILPTMWSAVDAGIPYETKKDYDKQIYRSMPEIMRPNETTYNKSSPWYLGAFGYSIPKETYPWPRAWKWLSEQDNDTPPESRPGFVSWWDYGFEAIQEGKHPAVADNFQNGYQIAAQIITAQNESEVISLFIARMLEADFDNNGGKLNSTVMNALITYAGEERAEKIVEILSDPASFKKEILDHPDIYGLYEDDISDKNAMYVAIKGTLAFISEDKLVSLYDAIRNATSWDIRYFAVDYRLFPFSGTQTGIFYAPAKLGDRRVKTVGTTVIPYDFYDLKAVDEYGHEYELDKVPGNVRIVSYKIEYKPMFYNSMLYRTFIGYSGKDIGKADGIPGFSASLGGYQPMQAWNMTHFKLVYKTAYWNPYKDYENHSDAWKPIPIDLALKYMKEGNGTVDLNPPAYQVLPNDVVMVKFYEGAIIEGYVRLTDGEPLKNVRVTILDEYGIPHDSVLTDDNGHFRIISVAGNMTLVVTTNGDLNKLRMMEKTILWQKSINVTEEQAMRLKPNYHFEENIVLKPATVDGLVYYDVNNDGKFNAGDVKVSNATLILRNDTYGFQKNTTIVDGNYKLSNLPPHTYSIDLIINGKRFNNVDTVTLNAGAIYPKDVVLQPSHVSGNLYLPTGEPAANATIDLKGFEATYVGQADENGHYDILVAPDNYTMVAHVGGFYSYKEEITIPSWNFTYTKNVTLHRAYTYQGYVYYNGEPLDGAVVKVKSELLPHSIYIATTRNGHFSFTLPGSIYSVYILTTEGEEKLAYFNIFSLRGNLSVGISLQEAHKVYGYITPADQLKGVEIYAFSGEKYTRWFANDSGYFEFYLPDGVYSIGFLAFNSSYVPYFDRVVVNLTKDVEINPILRAGEKVEGKVYYDVNGNGTAESSELLRNALVFMKDSRGFYEVRNIPPAGQFTLGTTLNYELQAMVYGYHQTGVEKENESYYYIHVEPDLIPVSGNVYVNGELNQVPLTIKLVSDKRTYTVSNVRGYYSLMVEPDKYTVEINSTGLNYHYEPIEINVDIDVSRVVKDIEVNATAHVMLISPATDVYWYQNGELKYTGKVVDIEPGTYTVYASNYTEAAVLKLDIWENENIEVLLHPSYYVDIQQENFTYRLPVVVETPEGNITWERTTILLPEGDYSFVINQVKMVWGVYYRYYASVEKYVSEDTSILLHVVTEKLLSQVSGYVYLNGNPTSDAVIRFIPQRGEAAQEAVATTGTDGSYSVMLTPGDYLVYTQYILGGKRYASISSVTVEDKDVSLDITYQDGYILQGAVYLGYDRVSAPVEVHTDYGKITMNSTGSYFIILPAGNYTVTSTVSREEYGMSVKYSFSRDIVLSSNMDLDVHLKRVNVHNVKLTVIATDSPVEPNGTMHVMLKMENIGNSPEDIRIEGLQDWNVISPQTYHLDPGQSTVVVVSLHVPMVQAGSNEVHIRARYGDITDKYFNVTVAKYYNTTVNYTFTSWDGSTLRYQVIVENNGNTWVNYTMEVLNSQELSTRGWNVTMYLNGKEVNYLNISMGSKAVIDVRITATKDRPGTSVPVRIGILEGDRVAVVNLPLEVTYLSPAYAYISAPKISNYTEFQVPVDWYIMWGATAALLGALIVLWRLRK